MAVPILRNIESCRGNWRAYESRGMRSKRRSLRSSQLRVHLAEKATLTETVGQFDGDLFVRLVNRVVVEGKAVVFQMKVGIEIRRKV